MFHDVDSNRIKKYHDGVITDIDRFNVGDFVPEQSYYISINIAPSVKGLSTVRVKVPEEYSLPRIVIENSQQIIYDNPNTSETFLNEWHNVGDICRDLKSDTLTIAEYVCVESGRPGKWKAILFSL